MSNFNFIGNFLGKRAKLTKDAHDLTNREAFSMPFGVHVPVKHYFTVPNEHYKGSVSGIVQTSPMREDNFAELDTHQKAVYVPMSSICRNYLQLTQADRDTRKDPLLDYKVYDLRFNVDNVLNTIFPYYFIHQVYQNLSSQYNLDNLLFEDFNGEEFAIIYDGVSIYNPSSSFNDLYRLGSDLWLAGVFFESGIQKGALRAISQISASDLFASSLIWYSRSKTAFCYDVLRLLDNLEFGNYLPLLEKRSNELRTYYKNLFDSYGVYVPANYAVLWFSIVDSISSIHFDYERYFNHVPSQILSHYNFDLWTLLAYQFYINIYERTNYRNPQSFALTGDFLLSEFSHGNEIASPHVHDSDLVYFNGDFVDLINDTDLSSSDVNLTYLFDKLRRGFNAQSTEPFLDSLSDCFPLMGYLFSLSNPLLPQDVFTTMQTSVVSGQIPTVDSSALSTNLVKSIAETSALYKLRQDLLRGGIRRDKQMLSIFGVSGNQHVYEPCKILADTSNPVQIQGLLNQAETEIAPLGSRGARGNGGVGFSFSLDTEDYGFIFIIEYFTCPIFYESFGSQRHHLTGASGWWIPQFNHLGLEPIYNADVSYFKGTTYQDFHSINSNKVIGFSARDWNLKQMTNKVHGLFTNYGFEETQNPIRSNIRNLDKALFRGNAAFGGFLPTVIQQQNSDGFDTQASLSYYPTMVNNLFTYMIGNAVLNDMSTDHFRCYNKYVINKVSPMPKLGLYKLDV